MKTLASLRTRISACSSRCRVGYWRLTGVDISDEVVLSSGTEFGGRVSLGNGTVVGRNTTIKGNVSIGKRCMIEAGVVIVGNITIGDGTAVGPYSQLSTMPEGTLHIGDDVHINTHTVIGACKSVAIHSHCIFAPFVQITDATHGFEDPSVYIKHAPISGSPIMIKEGVWLGSGVIVMMGVTIGEGTVVGAKALVTRSLPALSIAYGVPARVQRKRTGGRGLAGACLNEPVRPAL